MSSSRNKELRRLIAQEEKRLFGMSDMDINRQPILEKIKTLSAQIEPETHWTATPTFWVSVGSLIAASASAYFAFLALQSQAHKPVIEAPATVPQVQHSGDKKPNYKKQSEPKSQESQGSK